MFLISVELEELERSGFGCLKRVRCNHLFFKIPGSLIDNEVGHHVELVRMAGQDVRLYNELFCDTSKLSEDMMRICRNYHPQAELLEEENIL